MFVVTHLVNYVFCTSNIINTMCVTSISQRNSAHFQLECKNKQDSNIAHLRCRHCYYKNDGD